VVFVHGLLVNYELWTGVAEIPGGRLFFPLDEPQRVADEIRSALHPDGTQQRR
jgi:hypothetical protein